MRCQCIGYHQQSTKYQFHYVVRNYWWRANWSLQASEEKKGKKAPPRACCHWSGIQALEEKGTECALKGLLSLVIQWDNYKSNRSLWPEIKRCGVNSVSNKTCRCRDLYIDTNSETRLRELKMSLLWYIYNTNQNGSLLF